MYKTHTFAPTKSWPDLDKMRWAKKNVNLSFLLSIIILYINCIEDQ